MRVDEQLQASRREIPTRAFGIRKTCIDHMHGPRSKPSTPIHPSTGCHSTAPTTSSGTVIPLKILLDPCRLLGTLDARRVSLDLAGLTGELVHESRSGLERSGEVTLGLLAVEVKFGGFRPESNSRPSAEAQTKWQEFPTHSRTPLRVMMA